MTRTLWSVMVALWVAWLARGLSVGVFVGLVTWLSTRED